jgi:hypothetical protein
MSPSYEFDFENMERAKDDDYEQLLQLFGPTERIAFG